MEDGYERDAHALFCFGRGGRRRHGIRGMWKRQFERRGLLEQRLIVFERRVFERRVVERRVVERRLLERRILERRILERSVLERRWRWE